MIIPKRRVLTVLGAVIAIFVIVGMLASDHSNIQKPRLPKLSVMTESKLENATFMVLARNDELDKLSETITSYEGGFNHKFGYNWVFMNNEPFSDEFKEIIGNLVKGKAEFVTLPEEMWSLPEWVDPEAAKKSFKAQLEKGSTKADNPNYHHMCRFESGFFFNHPAMQKYKYYWRVEPGTTLLCDIDFDVFKYMSANKLKYAFTIAIWEQAISIEGLWDMTLRWINENPQYIHPNNLARIVTDRGGKHYNRCHFWSNFEIVDMDFYRSEAYMSFFNFLDKSGGFFFERWGDAPVHTLASTLLLDKSEVTHLDFVGYEHSPFARTPLNFLEREMKCISRERTLGADLDDVFGCLKQYYFALNDNTILPMKFMKANDRVKID